MEPRRDHGGTITLVRRRAISIAVCLAALGAAFATPASAALKKTVSVRLQAGRHPTGTDGRRAVVSSRHPARRVRAGAAKKRKRPLCKPAHAKVLTRTGSVRILYVEHPAAADEYGTPATVYACRPARKRRVKLFEVADTEIWSPKVMRIRSRWWAFAASTDDVACEKYAQPNCMGSYVAAYDLKTGALRCSTRAAANALALTSNGWIAWLTAGAAGRPATLSACDSGGVRPLDQGTIDPASLTASGPLITWARDGRPQSAMLG
jgi:hypothetical protein